MTDQTSTAATETPITVSAATELGGHIRDAAARGHGLVPRSSTGVARHGRATASDGSRLLDLSELRGIPLINAKERVAIVEAGVTYRQLQPLLDADGLRLCHPLLPPMGKSVVASQMDREPQMAPRHHWDFTDPMLCAELWFGTGDRFRTGSAAGPGSTLEEQWRAGMFQKNPLGPAQTDIAKLAQGSQGSLGVAAWSSVRLELRPELRRDLSVATDDIGRLADFLAAVTRRRICEEIVVFDRAQLDHVSNALDVDAGTGAADWTAMVVVGSLPRRPEQSLDVQLRQLRDLAASSGLTVDDLAGTPGEQLVRAVTSLPDTYEHHGDWKSAATGHSRELSFLTTADRALPLVEQVRTGWAPSVGADAVGAYLQPINQGRTCHVEMTAFCTPSEAETIDAGAAELVGGLVDAGAFFSRPIGAAVQPTFARCGDVVRTLHKVKAVLDPDDVLNPGALCFDPAVAATAFMEVSSS